MLKGWMMPRALGLTAAMGAILAAAPVLAQGLTVSDIALDEGLDVVMTLPMLSAVDANLDENAIRAIFSGEFDEADRAALSGLTATSITIPELRLTPVPSSDEDDGRHVTITGIELNDVDNGLAGTASIGEIKFNGGKSGAEGEDDADEPVDIALTGLETIDFDIAHLLRLMMIATGGEELAPDAAREDPRALFASLVVSGGSVTSEDGSCAVGSLTMESFAMRPPRTLAAPESETAEQQTLREEVNGIEALASIAAGPITLSSLDCDGMDDDDQPVTITAGPTTIGGLSEGQFAEMSLENLRIDSENEGWFEMARTVLKPMDITRWIEFYEAQRGDADPDVFEKATQLDQFTSFDGFSASGISFDIPDEETGERIAGSVDEVDFSLVDYVDGLPTSVSERINGIRIVIPENAETAGLIAALGTNEFVMDIAGDLHLERDAETLVFDKFAMDIANLGIVGFNGSIGNFTDAIYSAEERAVIEALENLTLKDLQIDLVDDGGLDLLIASVAAEQGVQPEQFRAAAAAMLQGTLIMGLGATPDAMGVAQVVSAFVNTGGSITLKATAIDPAGVTVPQFMAAEDDPTALMKLFTITATGTGGTVGATEPAATDQPTDKDAPEKSK